MFGFGYSNLFRSRWMALLWAAGIVWFAYTFAGSTGDDDNSAVAESNQVNDALNAL